MSCQVSFLGGPYGQDTLAGPTLFEGVSQRAVAEADSFGDFGVLVLLHLVCSQSQTTYKYYKVCPLWGVHMKILNNPNTVHHLRH